MLFSNILSIIAPYFIANERLPMLRGSQNECQIEAQCRNLHTCHDGQCLPYMINSNSDNPTTVTNTYNLYNDCIEDLEINEAFFYNSSPTRITQYNNMLGVSILFTRYEKNSWKSITIDDWQKYKKSTIRRIDNIENTDLFVAFCPIN